MSLLFFDGYESATNISDCDYLSILKSYQATISISDNTSYARSGNKSLKILTATNSIPDTTIKYKVDNTTNGLLFGFALYIKSFQYSSLSSKLITITDSLNRASLFISIDKNFKVTEIKDSYNNIYSNAGMKLKQND